MLIFKGKLEFCLVSSLKYIEIIKYKIKSGGASPSCILKTLIYKAFSFPGGHWGQIICIIKNTK